MSSCEKIKEILGSIEKNGFYCCENFFDASDVLKWKEYADTLNSENHFRDSGIGKNEFDKKDTSIRSDKIFWIDQFQGPIQSIGEWLDCLSTELKNFFRVPLGKIESHFSIYPRGSFYSKHIDNPDGLSPRFFTFICYLNPQWQSHHGGELVLYDPKNPSQELFRVAPRSGTLVLFRSEMFHHEVLESFEPRYTFTGWLRRDARV